MARYSTCANTPRGDFFRVVLGGGTFESELLQLNKAMVVQSVNADVLLSSGVKPGLRLFTINGHTMFSAKGQHWAEIITMKGQVQVLNSMVFTFVGHKQASTNDPEVSNPHVNKAARLSIVNSGSAQPPRVQVWSVDCTSGETRVGVSEYQAVLMGPRLDVVVENLFENTVVSKVDSGGAADTAGIVPGSLLLSVNSVTVLPLSHTETLTLVRRARSGPLALRLRRMDSGEWAGMKQDALRSNALRKEKPPKANRWSAWLPTEVASRVVRLSVDTQRALCLFLGITVAERDSPEPPLRAFLNDAASRSVAESESCLVVLAQATHVLVDGVGGTSHHGSLELLPLLELLLAVDVYQVWSTAIEAVNKCIVAPSFETGGQEWLGFLRRLGAHPFQSCRMAFCTLFPQIVGEGGLDDHSKVYLRGVFCRLAEDSSPGVRCAMTDYLSAVFLSTDWGGSHWVLDTLRVLSHDTSESVRQLLVNSCIYITQGMRVFEATAARGGEEQRGGSGAGTGAGGGGGGGVDSAGARLHLICCALIPVVTELALDQAWQVRLAVTESFANILKAFGVYWADVLLDSFSAGTVDSHPAVRAAAARALSELAQTLYEGSGGGGSGVGGSGGGGSGGGSTTKKSGGGSNPVCGSILQLARSMIADPDVSVRSGVATSVALMCAKLTNDEFMSHALPVVLELLVDQSAVVQRALVEPLRTVSCRLPQHVIEEVVVPQITTLQSSNNWRNRELSALFIPLCFSNQSEAEGGGVTDDDKDEGGGHKHGPPPAAVVSLWLRALELCVSLCSDSVADVRISAAASLCLCCKDMDEGFVLEYILPTLVQFTSGSHRLRILACKMFGELCGLVSHPIVELQLLPLIQTLASDELVNVRIGAAKGLAACLASTLTPLASSSSSMIETTVAALLKHLSEDTDSDVGYVASQALLLLDQQQRGGGTTTTPLGGTAANNNHDDSK